MELLPSSITLKLSTLFNKCPPCHTTSSLALASVLQSYCNNLESLRSALNVCIGGWKVDSHLTQRDSCFLATHSAPQFFHIT